MNRYCIPVNSWISIITVHTTIHFYLNKGIGIVNTLLI